MATQTAALEPASVYTFVGDTAPTVNFTFSRPGQSTVDLTGATVNLYIQNPNTLQRTNTGHTTCTLTNAALGKCSYTWMDGDLPVQGVYDATLRIVYSTGKKESAPVAIEVGSVV